VTKMEKGNERKGGNQKGREQDDGKSSFLCEKGVVVPGPLEVLRASEIFGSARL